MPRGLFTRTPVALISATALTLASALCYPGGTTLDHSAVGYSLLGNFLSDLGMTVAYNGQSNLLGALLFVLALLLTIGSAASVLWEFVRRCSAIPSGRRLARWAGFLGLIVCLAFAGVAFTPENLAMAFHLDFTLFAFRVAPVVMVLLTLAVRASGIWGSRVTLAFATLTSILAAYALLLTWGPSLSSASGLMTHVIAQKIVVIGAVLTIAYASLQAKGIVERGNGHS